MDGWKKWKIWIAQINDSLSCDEGWEKKNKQNESEQTCQFQHVWNEFYHFDSNSLCYTSLPNCHL